MPPFNLHFIHGLPLSNVCDVIRLCFTLTTDIIILFLNLYMFADTTTCGIYTTQNDNVYLQQNPAYELVYPVRPNLNMYQQ